MGYETHHLFLKDLALRQNREVTEAQLHAVKNIKKYMSKDLDNFVKDIKDKSFIINTLKPEKALWDYEQHKLCRVLSGDINFVSEPQNISQQKKTNDIRDVVKSTKNNKSIILQLNLLDAKRIENPQKIKIKYPAGLLDEFIQEYQKIIKWIKDNNFNALTLLGAGNEIRISHHEFEVAINFLEKMKLISEEK